MLRCRKGMNWVGRSWAQKSLYTSSHLDLSPDQKGSEVPFRHQIPNIFGLAHSRVFKRLM